MAQLTELTQKLDMLEISNCKGRWHCSRGSFGQSLSFVARQHGTGWSDERLWLFCMTFTHLIETAMSAFSKDHDAADAAQKLSLHAGITLTTWLVLSMKHAQYHGYATLSAVARKQVFSWTWLRSSCLQCGRLLKPNSKTFLKNIDKQGAIIGGRPVDDRDVDCSLCSLTGTSTYVQCFLKRARERADAKLVKLCEIAQLLALAEGSLGLLGSSFAFEKLLWTCVFGEHFDGNRS